jgi:hypothetical protein
LTINSTIFKLEKGQWIQKKVVNLGLVIGKSSIGSPRWTWLYMKHHKESERLFPEGRSPQQVLDDVGPELGNIPPPEIDSPIVVHQLGSISRDLKKTCPERLWKRAKSVFIKENWHHLNAFSIPWYTPEWCGGMGIPTDSEEEISREERLVAAVIKRCYKKLRPIALKDIAVWQMHQEVQKDLNEIGVPEEIPYNRAHVDNRVVDLEEEYSKVYKALTVRLLFNRTLSQIKYDVLPGDTTLLRGFKHNERIRRKAKKLISVLHPEPMSNDDMFGYEPNLIRPVCLVGQINTSVSPLLVGTVL